MPNTPKPPFSIYPLMAATGLSLMALGTAGLLVRQLSLMHGLTFLAGVIVTVALALTVGRPVLRKIAERQLGEMGGDPGPGRGNAAGGGRDDRFDFDPDTFEETRRKREEKERQKRIGEERRRAETKADQSTAKKPASKKEQRLDEKITSLRALLDHPTTPKHERAAAALALAKLITKRNKPRGAL